MLVDSEYLVRRLEPSDALSMLAAVKASLPELVYWMPWCKQDYSIEDAESWIQFTQDAWSSESEFPLGIFEAKTGAVIGGTGINHINKAYRIGNIGYWVSTPHVGRGVARFAAKQAALFGFGQLQLTRLEIVALTHNLASQRVAESLGATRECQARSRLYFQGVPHDAIVYSLVPKDTTQWQHAQWAVSSLKCNTLDVVEFEFGEDFSRGSEAEDFAGTVVKRVLDGGQLLV